MRSTFAALFCSAPVTFPAAAVRAQPAGTAEASAPTHDGFYLRLSLGGGALRAKFRDGNTVAGRASRMKRRTAGACRTASGFRNLSADAAFWQVKAAASREYSLSMLRAQPMFGEGDDHYSRTRAYGRARRLGLPGFCGMLCPTRTGHAVTVGTPLMEARGGIRSRVLDQLAAHVAAAWRLRMRLATPDAFEESAEATFHPSGRLEDALGPAKSGDVRQRLRSLVLAREKALRGKEERLWPALLGGRYTIVDLFESSGARYVVAHRNPATAADLSRLDDRERQVVEGVAAGKLEKVLAIDLGVSESHLSKILHCALRRLGLSSAIDLTLIASCSDAVPLDDEVLGGSIVAAFRLRGPTADALLGLTPAERAITSDILRGLSNREIAARRNRSQRTIANQVVSVLEKMRVPTRRALVASLTRA